MLYNLCFDSISNLFCSLSHFISFHFMFCVCLCFVAEEVDIDRSPGPSPLDNPDCYYQRNCEASQQLIEPVCVCSTCCHHLSPLTRHIPVTSTTTTPLQRKKQYSP